MVQGVLFSVMVISIFLFIMLIRFFGRQVNVLYLLVFVIVIFADYGYLIIAGANNLETAIIGNTISYLGGSFVPFLLMMCVAEICHIRQHKAITVAEFVLCSVVFASVNTIGHNDWYYKNVDIIREGNVTQIVKEYGPLHTLYTFSLILFTFITVGFVVYSFFNQATASYKASLMLCVLLALNIGVYVLGRFIRFQINMLPISYMFSQIALLILLVRVKMYDITRIVVKSISDSNEIGLVMFDKKMNYIGCNHAAKIWFEELNGLRIDYRIDNSDTELFRLIHDFENGSKSGANINCGEKIIRCRIKDLINENNKKKIGYYVEMGDETDRIKYVDLIKNYNETLEREVNAKTKNIENMRDDIILSMADTVENRDLNTGGHIRRTSEGVRIFTQKLMSVDKYKEYGDKYYECIIKAAPLHDFGKIAISDKILQKPGKFTPEEYEEMKKHSEKGATIVGRILQNSDDRRFRDVAVNIAHYHHEKWDGTGYPKGLKGEEIPLESRIMAFADVFDALVSKRCYKDKYSYDQAFNIIKESLGSHFDSALGQIFISCRPELEKFYSEIEEN